MATERLIPDIDRRLASWIELQGRLSERAPAPGGSITISRQFGCEAFPLAEMLAGEIGRRTGVPWTVFDRALIDRVVREEKLPETLLANLGDASQVLDHLAAVIPGWHTHREAYALLARHLVAIAREGNAIIVGLGGAVITRDLPNCFHVRLEAPLEHRVKSIQRRLDVPRDRAQALVLEHEEQRDRFIESFLGCSMADTRHYHVVFNTARSPLERIVASVVALMPPTSHSGE